ncbi:MAG TPA: hypothetical protein EYN58_06200 [Candidatus Poseidoniales archaeon]|nr:MAG: hypothetical protein CXX81_24930 [Euryarchaeota archaeon]HHZ74749.1 hypothetical protein [Candidatus Poseidoniales archaeon]PXY74882.1 MAG: hypothetical protein CXX81_20175 [Euryarchaeota archaeon]PXY77101.1 MAG: hypothetical protein CXX81_12965 [Euryarchaeota archaeon]PXY79759.1 MAG: hypothetical protein CXX81_01230 [Euryarchaeota archaeon]
MVEKSFRWRDSPAVIARYIHDRDVPSGSMVTLKPNEACVVVEDGKIAGVATQQHLEVNPKAGLLSRMFGRGNPKRTFLFAFLGPHDLLLRLNTQTTDGQPAIGMLNLRLNITREQAPKLLQLPAKGKMEITTGTLVDALEKEIQSNLNPMIQGQTIESLRTVEATEELLAELRVSMRATVTSFGFTFDNVFVNWNQTEAEQLLKMSVELENLVMRNTIIDEKEATEMERILSHHMRKAELQARLNMTGVSAEERAKVELELAKVKSSGELELARWNQLNQLQIAKQDSRRGQELTDAHHDVEVTQVKLEAEREINQFQDGKADAEIERNLAEKRGQAEIAMDLFASVQDRKKERMALEAEREQARLESSRTGSDKILDALTDIAKSSDDSEVAKEALKQLGDLRKSDVEGEDQAHINKED